MIETTNGPQWRRSKRCSNGACVEVATDGDRFLMRDSKDRAGAPLSLDRAQWHGFLAGIKAGDFA
ncbi:DUF397 domain-containing protein [Actinoplanes sp. NPDC051851]|uniref:DUF397 domain-containing protein n=1 Tax=Actinoplanes sp. NPDC051851 TaxID=3154753 RepID=UPI00343A3BA8